MNSVPKLCVYRLSQISFQAVSAGYHASIYNLCVCRLSQTSFSLTASTAPHRNMQPSPALLYSHMSSASTALQTSSKHWQVVLASQASQNIVGVC
jgi:hypothetical protein